MSSMREQMGKMLDWFSDGGVDHWNFAILNRLSGAMKGDARARNRAEVEKCLGWGWHENKNGADIYIRPARRLPNGEMAAWPVVFADDVPPAAIDKINTGALVIATSPCRHHVWLRVSSPLAENERRTLQNALQPVFTSDPASTSGEHFGRAVGFWSIKRGCAVRIVKVIEGPALVPDRYISSPPFAQEHSLNGARACILKSAGDQPIFEKIGGGSESERVFGYIIGKLRWAKNTAGIDYFKIRRNVVVEQTNAAMARGKRKTQAECERWVNSVVEAAEKRIS